MKTVSTVAWIVRALTGIPSASADLGDPLPGLTAAQSEAFLDGQEDFEEEEDVFDGLGPVFNEASCVACHLTNGSAVGGSTGRLETRFGRTTNGVFDPLASLGGSLMQDHGLGSMKDYWPNDPVCAARVYVAEVVPATANVVALRRTTPLFGLGLVNAVPDSSFQAAALYQAVFTPGQAGVVSKVVNPDTGATVVGKFGWKAQVPTLHAFAADAYLNEMGVTSPAFPNESCPQGNCSMLSCNVVPDLNDEGDDVEAFTDFMRFLGPPPPPPSNVITGAGTIIFNSIGCGNCHTQTMTTGANPIAALNQVRFAPYSDFLLHDMGALGDGITQNKATGRLMRTAPLWGLKFSIAGKLLHDGRAATVADAILAHAGQGLTSRNKFAALNVLDRATLLAFLSSL